MLSRGFAEHVVTMLKLTTTGKSHGGQLKSASLSCGRKTLGRRRAHQGTRPPPGGFTMNNLARQSSAAPHKSECVVNKRRHEAAAAAAHVKGGATAALSK